MFSPRYDELCRQAELTRDMVEAMLASFDTCASVDGVITVEFRDNALWVAGAHPHKEFLGLACLPQPLRHLK